MYKMRLSHQLFSILSRNQYRSHSKLFECLTRTYDEENMNVDTGDSDGERENFDQIIPTDSEEGRDETN